MYQIYDYQYMVTLLLNHTIYSEASAYTSPNKTNKTMIPLFI